MPVEFRNKNGEVRYQPVDQEGSCMWWDYFDPTHKYWVETEDERNPRRPFLVSCRKAKRLEKKRNWSLDRRFVEAARVVSSYTTSKRTT